MRTLAFQAHASLLLAQIGQFQMHLYAIVPAANQTRAKGNLSRPPRRLTAEIHNSRPSTSREIPFLAPSSFMQLGGSLEWIR